MPADFRLCNKRLSEAAEAKGDRTSYAIAKRTGLAQSTVNRLRRGLARPTTGSLLVLASAYGVTVGDLIQRDGDGDVDPIAAPLSAVGTANTTSDGAPTGIGTPLAKTHPSTSAN